MDRRDKQMTSWELTRPCESVPDEHSGEEWPRGSPSVDGSCCDTETPDDLGNKVYA